MLTRKLNDTGVTIVLNIKNRLYRLEERFNENMLKVLIYLTFFFTVFMLSSASAMVATKIIGLI